jgi:site-specific recombinase XerD
MTLPVRLEEARPPWWIGAQLPLQALDQMQGWWDKARHAYPETTKKAWRSDWKLFSGFCLARGECPLPAESTTVAAFVDDRRLNQRKPASIRRYLATITRAHEIAGLADPCRDQMVQLELRSLNYLMSTRQRQARALNWDHIQRFLASAGTSLRATRERALLSVAYDVMARRSELVALNVDDVAFLNDGSGRALIRRSKTDQTGEGHSAYLSCDSVRYVRAWLAAGRIETGALFRRIVGANQVGGRLSANAITQIFKAVAAHLKLPPHVGAAFSGHSVRVGATQDLLALNIDLGSVMQAGRWRTSRMPMRYGEHVLAAKGGMARAADAQGRNRRGEQGGSSP